MPIGVNNFFCCRHLLSPLAFTNVSYHSSLRRRPHVFLPQFFPGLRTQIRLPLPVFGEIADSVRRSARSPFNISSSVCEVLVALSIVFCKTGGELSGRRTRRD